MTIISSWGGGTSNSYISYSAANSYATTALIDYSAWDSATVEQREAALIEASQDIDSMQYVGARYYFEQALEFPRRLRTNYPYGTIALSGSSTDVFQTRMKRAVEEATVHQAVWRLSGKVNDHLTNVMFGVTQQQQRVGPLMRSTQYGQGATGGTPSLLHPKVKQLLAPYKLGRRVWRG